MLHADGQVAHVGNRPDNAELDDSVLVMLGDEPEGARTPHGTASEDAAGVDRRESNVGKVSLEEARSIEHEDGLWQGSVSPRVDEDFQLGLVDPEEDMLVEDSVPVGGRQPVGQASRKVVMSQWKLIAHYRGAVLGMLDSDRVSAPLCLDSIALGPADFEEVEQCAGAEQAVLLDRRPAIKMGHVEQPREASRELGRIHHQRRRSMMLRNSSKRVEMRDTGARATTSISSTILKVSSVSCLVSLARSPVLAFAAAPTMTAAGYRVDYAIPSAEGWVLTPASRSAGDAALWRATRSDSDSVT